MSSYHHGDLRAALVAAGVEILERDGFESLTLRAAARAVGVSHAAPARHFADVSAFRVAIAAAGYQLLSSYLELPGFTDPFARYLESGRAYVRFAIEHPQLYRATMLPLDPGADLTAELEDAAEGTFGQLQGIVEAAMSVGAIRTGDAYAVAISSWTVAHGIAMLLIDGQLPRKHPGQKPEEIADAIFTRMYFGLHP